MILTQILGACRESSSEEAVLIFTGRLVDLTVKFSMSLVSRV